MRIVYAFLTMTSYLLTFTYLLLPLCACTEGTNGDIQTDMVSSQGIDPRLSYHATNSALIELGGNCYKFSFGQSNGDAVPLAGVPTPVAMRQAAALFALQTGAVEVTAESIIKNGYWPYDVFSTEFDKQQLLSNTTETVVLPESLSADVGGAEWMLEAREYILTSFYNEYYYLGNLGTSEEKYTEAPITPERLEPIADFWVSPLTNQKFNYGERKGDISECPMSGYFAGPQCLLSNEAREQSVLVMINTEDLIPSSFRENGKVTSDYPDGWCCFFRRQGPYSLPGSTQFSQEIECPCPGTSASTTCYVTWYWTDGAQYYLYTAIGISECTDYPDPPSDMVKIPCGEWLNMYWYPASSGQPQGVAVACGQCPVAGHPEQYYILQPNPGDCPELDSLLSDINNMLPVLRGRVQCTCG
jgi:hypothetical protein